MPYVLRPSDSLGRHLLGNRPDEAAKPTASSKRSTASSRPPNARPAATRDSQLCAPSSSSLQENSTSRTSTHMPRNPLKIQKSLYIVLEDAIAAVDAATARRDRLEAQIEAALPEWTLAPVVDALQALRGVRLIAAATMMAELGDMTRFSNPRQLMAYVGLVPSEHSSGNTRRQGGITKAGNGMARRMLIEAAWSYRFPARISREQLLRQEHLAKPIRDIAWKAQERLCRRYRKMVRGGKLTTVITAAIARELRHSHNLALTPGQTDQQGNTPRPTWAVTRLNLTLLSGVTRTNCTELSEL